MFGFGRRRQRHNDYEDELDRLWVKLHQTEPGTPEYRSLLEDYSSLQARRKSDKEINTRVPDDRKSLVFKIFGIGGLMALNRYLDDHGDGISAKGQRISNGLMDLGMSIFRWFGGGK